MSEITIATSSGLGPQSACGIHSLSVRVGIPFAFREKRTSSEWNVRAAATKAREDANATRLARGVVEIAHPLSTAADLDEAVSMLRLLREHAAAYREDGPEALFIRGRPASWNVGDTYMVETPDRPMAFHGPSAKAIVWEPHHTGIPDFVSRSPSGGRTR